MNALKRFHSIVSDEEKYMSSKLIAYNTSNEFSLKKMEEIHGIKKFELINFPWIGYQPKQCDICREKDSCDKDPLVQCSICKFYVHKNCYSRPISPVVSWICQRCIFILENPDFSHLKLCCALCKSFKGLLTLVQNEYWVHIECVFWCPMLSFEDSVEKDTVIGNFDPIAVSKNMSICLYCQKKGIILTKCDYPSCKIKFCTRCAGFYRWIIKGCTQMEKQEGENGQLLFCEFHQQEGIKKIVKQKQTKLSEFYLEDKKVLDVMEPINKISERLNEVCKANKEIKSQNKNFNLKHEKLETKVCTLQNISIADNPGSPSPELPLQPSLESLGLGGIEIEFSKENEYGGTDASQVFNTSRSYFAHKAHCLTRLNPEASLACFNLSCKRSRFKISPLLCQ
ncbi:unnamed protein product [Moneuplotes crassus]|uniref:Uncharacterized protein n=1 Tax=Euplotes crassus TaxID=5936 RepID=A0AAD1X848_EUPCR|nr:unnamed protein product [Moneuplotes crassus]